MHSPSTHPTETAPVARNKYLETAKLVGRVVVEEAVRAALLAVFL